MKRGKSNFNRFQDDVITGQLTGGDCPKMCCNDSCSDYCYGNATYGCDCCGKGRVRNLNDSSAKIKHNPADSRGFGFTTKYDGRIRGGIRTPDSVYSPPPSRVFDIFNNE